MEFGTNCHLSTCLHLTFLPLSCPYCHEKFCESHFLPGQHACRAPGGTSAESVLSENEVLKRVMRSNASLVHPEASSSSGGGRLPCQKRGCRAFSLEVGVGVGVGAAAAAAAGGGGTGSNSPKVIVKDGKEIQPAERALQHVAPSCLNCKGLYCTSHRTPKSHDCRAPVPLTDGQKRMQEADERKRKAREILNKNFPNRGSSASTTVKK